MWCTNMVNYTISRSSPHPVDKVFEIFSEFDKLPDRIPNIKSIQALSEGEIREGFRFKETRVISGYSASEEFLVENFMPPNYFTLSVTSCGVKYTYIYNFESAVENTGTKFRLIGSVWPYTIYAWLFYPLMWWFSSHFIYDTERDVDTLLANIGT
eukprot:TRINITY_DN107836_c0_g1_i1.p2 TRINITY_DN107836_c0_g1~~TRINITY_DN107836_c0_g1_i1.p2  ORF type:complete len:155 (-),score=3.65 TRINITY_DN107836_c0_g1_i1:102-566(-)